jgi:hypothetical protein
MEFVPPSALYDVFLKSAGKKFQKEKKSGTSVKKAV